jgi:tripartite-type tricarboxylate transporter receptor subunit TctC
MKRWLAFLALALAVFAAWGQTYPSRPVRLIVPFPPGGGFDGIARPFAEKLGSLLGQTLVIENRAGAAGNVGAEVAARATPDGYTLLFANDFLATNPPMLKSTAYDPLKDFVPITRVGTVATALVTHPSIPASNLKDLMALSKTRPLHFGTPGVGSVPHLVGELMNLEGVMRLVHVPYKGSGPALADLMAANIDFISLEYTAVEPHVKSGKLKALATATAQRVPGIDLPTVAEAGYPGFEVTSWYAIFGPAGIPRDVTQKLAGEIHKAVNETDLRERLKGLGTTPIGSTPEALAAYQRSDIERWTKVVKTAGIKPE